MRQPNLSRTSFNERRVHLFFNPVIMRTTMCMSTRLFSCYHTLLSSTKPLIFPPSPLGRSPFLAPCKANSLSNAKSSSSGDYHLVSTNELTDGSVVFRFGDENELAKFIEMEKAKLSREVAETEVTDEEITSHSEANGTKTEVVHSLGETGGSKDASTGDHRVGMNEQVLEDHLADVDLTDASEECPPEMISYKIMTPPAVSGDGEEGNHSNEAGPTEEMVSSEEILKEESEVEYLNPSVLSVSSSAIEVADNVSSNASMDTTEIEDTQRAVANQDQNVNTKANPLIDHDGDGVPIKAIANVQEESTSNVPLHVNDTERLKLLMQAKIVQSSSGADVSGPHSIESQTTADTIASEEFSTTGFILSSGAASLPHPSKDLTGREDAYFVDRNWLAIADGVGQWSQEGTKAGVFARELVENCKRIVSDDQSIAVSDPVEVLDKAVVETQSPGSSTALVSYFDGQCLHVANIGHSGFVIIRNGTIFRSSSPLLHEFFFPLQITKGDDPFGIVERYKVDLDVDDIIINASDGLFDNLYEQEIASIVSNSLQDNSKAEEIAALLAARAQETGKLKSGRSPFGDAAKAAGYVGYSGGKLDNVTVIVSIVQCRSTISSSMSSLP